MGDFNNWLNGGSGNTGGSGNFNSWLQNGSVEGSTPTGVPQSTAASPKAAPPAPVPTLNYTPPPDPNVQTNIQNILGGNGGTFAPPASQPFQPSPAAQPTTPAPFQMPPPQNDAQQLFENAVNTPVLGDIMKGIGGGLNALGGGLNTLLGNAQPTLEQAKSNIEASQVPQAVSQIPGAINNLPFIGPYIAGAAGAIGDALQGYQEHIGNPVAGYVAQEQQVNPIATALSPLVGVNNSKVIEDVLMGRHSLADVLTPQGYATALATETSQHAMPTDVAALSTKADVQYKAGDITGAAATTFEAIQKWGSSDYNNLAPVQQLAASLLYDPLNFVGAESLFGGIGHAQQFVEAAQATADVTKVAETMDKAPLLAKMADKISLALGGEGLIPRAENATQILGEKALGLATPAESSKLRYLNPATWFTSTPISKGIEYINRAQDYYLNLMHDTTISRDVMVHLFDQAGEAVKANSLEPIQALMADHKISNTPTFQRFIKGTLGFIRSGDLDTTYGEATNMLESLKQWINPLHGEPINAATLQDTLFSSTPFKDMIASMVTKGEEGKELTKYENYMNDYSGAFNRFNGVAEKYHNGKAVLSDLHTAMEQLSSDIENIGKFQMGSEYADHAQHVIQEFSQLPTQAWYEKFANRIRPYESVLFIATNPHAVVTNAVGNWISSAIHGVSPWESQAHISSFYGRAFGATNAKDIKQVMGSVGDVLSAITKDAKYSKDINFAMGGKLPDILTHNPLANMWTSSEYGANLRSFMTGYNRAYKQVWKYGVEIPKMDAELETVLRTQMGDKLFKRLTNSIEDTYNSAELKTAVDTFFKEPKWQEYRDSIATNISAKWSERLGKPISITPDMLDQMVSTGNSDRINSFLKSYISDINKGVTPEEAFKNNAMAMVSEARKHQDTVISSANKLRGDVTQPMTAERANAMEAANPLFPEKPMSFAEHAQKDQWIEQRANELEAQGKNKVDAFVQASSESKDWKPETNSLQQTATAFDSPKQQIGDMQKAIDSINGARKLNPELNSEFDKSIAYYQERINEIKQGQVPTPPPGVNPQSVSDGLVPKPDFSQPSMIGQEHIYNTNITGKDNLPGMQVADTYQGPGDVPTLMKDQTGQEKPTYEFVRGDPQYGPVQRMLQSAGMTPEQMTGLNRAQTMEQAAKLNLKVYTDTKTFVPTIEDLHAFAKGRGVQDMKYNLPDVIHNWRPFGVADPTVDAGNGHRIFANLKDSTPEQLVSHWNTLVDYVPRNQRTYSIPLSRGEFWDNFRQSFRNLSDQQYNDTKDLVDRWAISIGKSHGWDMNQTYREVFAAVEPGKSQGGKVLNELQQTADKSGLNNFYSHLSRSVDNLPMDSMTAEQAKAMLTKAGVKPAEWKWTNMDEFINSHPKFTKQELQDYVKANTVQVREVQRIGNQEFFNNAVPNVDNAGNFVKSNQPITQFGPDTHPTLNLPGGQDYKELELIYDNPPREEYRALRTKFANETETPEELLRFEQMEKAKSNSFQSSHFPESNILAHVRFDTRIDAEGKKVLFLQEVQSDWGQAGRSSGFDTTSPELEQYQRLTDKLHKAVMNDSELQAIDNELSKIDFSNYDDPYAAENLAKQTELEKQYNALSRSKYADLHKQIEDMVVTLPKRGETPVGPFVTNTQSWTDLSLKRMMQYASENGYDRLAWTTGAQQAERYTNATRSVVDKIKVAPNDGKFLVRGYKNGGSVFTEIVEGDKLSGIVGQDIAKKVINDGIMSFEGEGLTIGAEGMKGYYDKILPESANKLAKKWDTKVGETAIDVSEPGPGAYVRLKRTPDTGEVWGIWDEKSQNWFDSKEYSLASQAELDLNRHIKQGSIIPLRQSANVHALDISPTMRDSVLRDGFPLFQNNALEKGSTTFTVDGHAIVRAVTQSHDVSTAVHEVAHAFLPWLPDNEMKVFEDWTGLQPGEFKQLHVEFAAGTPTKAIKDKYVAAQEQFARGFEQYLSSGTAPTPELQSIFDRFKGFLKDIYQKIVGGQPDAQLTPEMRGLYDRLTNVSQEDLNAARGTEQVAQQVATPPMPLDPTRIMHPSTPPDWVSKLTPEDLVKPEARMNADNQMVQDLMDELKNILPNEQAMPMHPMTSDLKNRVNQYINGKVIPAQRDSRLVATAHGRWYQGHTVLNYNNRWNVDDALSLYAPFTYWPLHMAVNLSQEFIDRPQLLNYYMHLRKSYNDFSNSQTANMPARFQGRIKIPLPFMPEWMGNDIWTNPFRTLFPIEDIFHTDALQRASYTNLPNATGQDPNPPDPQSTLSDIFGAHLPIKLMMQLVQGDQAGVQDTLANLPPVRIGKALGLIPLDNGLNIGGINPTKSKWDSFYIERSLRDMLANGEINQNVFKRTLLERSGPIWQTAMQHAQLQNYTANVVPGFLGLSGKVYPVGEQIYTNTRLQRDALVDQEIKRIGASPSLTTDQKYQALNDAGEFGQGGVMRQFYDAHPELVGSDIVGQRKATDDEKLYRSWLTDSIWQKVTSAPELQQRLWKAELGQEFNDYFYAKKSRDYTALTTETLSGWANAMKVGLLDVSSQAGYVQPQPDPYKVTFPTKAENDAYDSYSAQVDTLVGWDNYFNSIKQYDALNSEDTKKGAAFKLTSAGKQMVAVWGYQKKFYADNPGIHKMLEAAGLAEAQQSSALPGSDQAKGAAFSASMSAVGYQSYDEYKAERDKYFTYPAHSQERIDYLVMNPRLARMFSIDGGIYGTGSSTSTRTGVSSSKYIAQTAPKSTTFPHAFHGYGKGTPQGIDWGVLSPLLKQFGQLPVGSQERIDLVNQNPELQYYFRMTPVPNMRLPYYSLINGRINYQPKQYVPFKANPGVPTPTRKTVKTL